MLRLVFSRETQNYSIRSTLNLIFELSHKAYSFCLAREGYEFVFWASEAFSWSALQLCGCSDCRSYPTADSQMSLLK